MAEEQAVRNLVSVDENEDVSRTLRAWLNTYPNKPLSKLDFEWLGADSGLCLSTIQSSYKTKQYIDGTYQAQYQFKIVYRLTAVTANERLAADEALDGFGAWAETHTPLPAIADNIRVIKIKRDSASSLFARYEGDTEDHQILMTLIYEVI